MVHFQISGHHRLPLSGHGEDQVWRCMNTTFLQTIPPSTVTAVEWLPPSRSHPACPGLFVQWGTTVLQSFLKAIRLPPPSVRYDMNNWWLGACCPASIPEAWVHP